ncbi:MAG: hypothetical protein WCL00_09470, partial [Bacteroidota bacterium]
QFGLFTLSVGKGTAVSGTFAGIPWATVNAWMEVELDPAGGSSYVMMGSSQMLSVPYALYASSGGTTYWSENGSHITNNNNGNVGIGTSAPGDKLSLRGGAFSFHPVFNDIPYTGIDFDETGDGMRFRANISSSALNTTQMFISRTSGNVGIGTSTPAAKLDVEGNVKIADGTQAAGKVLTSDASGNGSWQAPVANQVSFKSQLLLNQININGGSNQVFFDSVIFNNGNSYNKTTGLFTAPSAGMYYFHAQLLWISSNLPHTVRLTIMKNNFPFEVVDAAGEITATMGYAITSTSALMYLNSGDTVKVLASEESTGSAIIDYYDGGTHFFGYKVY